MIRLFLDLFTLAVAFSLQSRRWHGVAMMVAGGILLPSLGRLA